MKHSKKIVGIMLAIFLLAQFIGLGIVYYDHVNLQESSADNLVFLEPDVEAPVSDTNMPFFFIILILIGTGIALLIIKFNLNWIWRIWFLLAVLGALTFAFAPFVGEGIAFLIALVFAIWKVFRDNFWVHTGTELFIYGGIATLVFPWFNLQSVSILLILIAIYDAYAVWKSKHMITLAKSQSKAKVFAGLLVPYSIKRKKKVKRKGPPVKVRVAMLGGGDIAFPLIFAGIVMKDVGLWQSLLIPLFAMGGLAYLLWFGSEKKFYPAMPFIGVGCFVGLGVVWILQMLI